MSDIGNQTVQWLAAAPSTVKNAWGQHEITATSYAAPVEIDGVALQPEKKNSSAETISPIQDQVVTKWLMWVPAPVPPIGAFDRVQYGALVFDVDGDPVPWEDGDGNVNHAEVKLKMTEG